MASSRVDGDLHVTGSASFGSITIPPGSLTNAGVASGAAIAVEKVESLVIAGLVNGYATAYGAVHNVVFVAPTTGTIRGFRCGFVGKCTTGTAGFDLNINNVSALSAHITFTTADTNGEVKTAPGDASLSTSALVAGDIVSIQLTSDSGSPDGTGAFAQIELDMVAP